MEYENQKRGRVRKTVLLLTDLAVTRPRYRLIIVYQRTGSPHGSIHAAQGSVRDDLTGNGKKMPHFLIAECRKSLGRDQIARIGKLL